MNRTSTNGADWNCSDSQLTRPIKTLLPFLIRVLETVLTRSAADFYVTLLTRAAASDFALSIPFFLRLMIRSIIELLEWADNSIATIYVSSHLRAISRDCDLLIEWFKRNILPVIGWVNQHYSMLLPKFMTLHRMSFNWKSRKHCKWRLCRKHCKCSKFSVTDLFYILFENKKHIFLNKFLLAFARVI